MSVELDEVRGFLAQHEPFSHLPEEELADLPAAMTIKYFRRGEVIVSFGQVNDNLHIIRSGAIDILGEDDMLLDRREVGLTFGYSTLVGSPESQYTMQAVEDSLVYLLPRDAFTHLAERNPDIDRFFSSQSRRIRAAAQQLGEDSSTGVLRTRLSEVMVTAPQVCTPATSIVDAAVQMTAAKVSSLLVTSGEDGATLCGIITDRDMRSRVVAAGHSPQAPVEEVMTSQLVTVGSDTLAVEALLLMSERGFHHLPVVDSGRVSGVVTQADIARLLHDDPIFLTSDFSHKDSVGELADAFTRTTELAARYIERGAAPEESAGIITIAADALARRLFALGLEKFGPAPVDFAFVAVGSQGRREMALASDQDNALVLANDFDPDAHGEYFQQLSAFVCEGLAQAGQDLCPGDMMAMNPQWRMTVEQWKQTFHTWISAPEPDALLNAQIFFDFRTIYGNAELGQQVHAYAVDAGQGARRLHAHLASLAARREPPLTFFRGLVVERTGDYANTLDIKKGGTAGIVQMARLYALSSGSDAVDTRERLHQAAGKAVSTKGAQDLLDAFNYLRLLTLQHQAKQLREQEKPDYHIDPKDMGRMDREHLRDAFRIIKSMQNALATKYPVRNI